MQMRRFNEPNNNNYDLHHCSEIDFFFFRIIRNAYQNYKEQASDREYICL